MRRSSKTPRPTVEFFRDLRQFELFPNRQTVTRKLLLGDWRPKEKR